MRRRQILRRIAAIALAVIFILSSALLYAPASADAGNAAQTAETAVPAAESAVGAVDLAGDAENETPDAGAEEASLNAGGSAETAAGEAAAETEAEDAAEQSANNIVSGEDENAQNPGTVSGEDENTQNRNEAAGQDAAAVGEVQKSANDTVAAKNAVSPQNKALDAADILSNEEDDLPADTSALDITSYITSTTLSYVTASGSTQQTVAVDADTVIPAGVRTFEVNILYSGINAQELKNQYGGQVYYEAPDFFSAVSVVNGQAMSGSTVIGTVTAEGRRIIVSFYDSFFNNIDENAEVTDAHIQFRATADESKITENPVQVHIGNVDFNLTFAEKDVAYSGELAVTKSSPTYIPDPVDPASAGYLEYTVTVSTGEEAMPDVRVEDSITAGGRFVSAWLSEDGSTTYSSAGTTLADNSTVAIEGSNPGKLVWTIGNMSAHETKNLTYRIKLSDSYVGIADSYYNSQGAKTGKKVITNTAVPYSKTYPHDSAASTYEPTVSANVEKTAGSIVDDVQGGRITIPFTIRIQASSENPWPLRNVKIADNFYSSYTGQTAAADRAAILAACRNGQDGYGLQDFKVYEIGPNGEQTELQSVEGLKVYYETNNAYNPRFDVYIGNVPAGKTHVLTYNLVLDKSFFASRSGSWTLRNGATVRTDDNKNNDIGGNASLGAASSTKTVGQQQWDRKIQSDQIRAAVVQHPDGMEEKTVPAGSYLYRVVVNEAAGWDVSGAIFNDALGTDEEHTATSHMRYRGYLKIDYFKDGVTYRTDTDGNPIIPSDDTEVADALAEKTPDKTVYIDIDEKQSFSFKPSDYGFSGEGAFLLTYYAEPFDLGSVTSTASGNTFSLSGTVGIGGGSFALSATAVRIHKSVTIEGTSNFTAAKRGWYFDSNEKKLYWVIEASGSTVLPAALALRDTTGSSNRSVSLVGAYIGALTAADGHFTTQFSDFRDFETNGSAFRALTSGEDYTFAGGGTNTATLTLSKQQTLGENEKLFIVLTTVPSISNAVKRGVYTAANNLLVQEAGTSTFRESGTATLLIPGMGTDFKEMNRVLTRDADGNWSSVSGGNSSSVLTSEIKASGIYIDWRIKVNWLADLSGTVHVSDTLPEGLTPVYVRYFWIDSGLDNTENAPTMPAISDLGSGWQDIGLKNAIMDNGARRPAHDAYAYYNAQTREIRFDVGNLKDMYALYYAGQLTGNAETVLKDKYSLEVQIVTKVTDEDVLAGERKSFGNTMTVTDEKGLEVSRDSANAAIQQSTVAKTLTSTNVQENGVVPFSITVNPLGETLAGGASTLTLVDELLDPLAFNPESVKVTDRSGNDVTSQVIFTSGDRNTGDTGTLIRFVIPNGQKLTITYSATPRVGANETYTVNNRAYWYGHTGGESRVIRENIRNSVSAGARINQPAAIKVVKRDKDNAGLVLEGAVFSLNEYRYNTETDTFDYVSGGDSRQGVTGSNGEVTFDNLKYNTIYHVYENSPPDGYTADAGAQYILIAQAVDGAYPAELSTYRDKGVLIEYNDYTYTADYYDTKEKIPVEVSKIFYDATNRRPMPLSRDAIPDGTYRFGLYIKDTDDRVQTLAITYTAGVETYQWTHTVNGQTVDEFVDSAAFQDVPAGEYEVFELDANGNPIKTSGTQFLLNGRTFEARWYRNNVTVTNSPGNGVGFINIVYPEIPPDTAGPSGRNRTYIWIILAAIGAFSAFMVYEHKRRNRN